MAIKTFDANRVGGGTFQLEQDATTGEYTLKEVGFIKVPELKLPEIDQAAFTATTTSTTPTTSAATSTGINVGGVSTTGGGGEGKQDFTGESTFKNIQKVATGQDLQAQAKDLAKQDTGIQMQNIGNEDTNPALKAYNDALKNYNAIAERNRDLAMGKQNVTEEDRLQNKADIAAAKNQLDSSRQNYEKSIAPVDIAAAPKISEDLTTFGPTTVTRGATGVPDAIIQGQPAPPDTVTQTVTTGLTNIAKKIMDASITVKIIDAIAGEETADQKYNKATFKTRGDLGSSNDPDRIVGDPTQNVFAGMNRSGNLTSGAQRRIDMRNSKKTQERMAKKGKEALDAFNEKTRNFEKQLQKDNNDRNTAREKARIKQATNPNKRSGAGDGGSGGRSKIVCTMMNESYGFGSFRNKIWLRHSKNLAPEYQIGYHRIFLPLVKLSKTNKIIKKILEHIAIHRTIDIRQEEKNKIHILGRMYRKILEPICYLVGKI